MKKDSIKPEDDDLRPEYKLSELKGGVRGKYLERYRQGTNLAAFPTDEAVNQALRSLAQAALSSVPVSIPQPRQ